MKTRKGVGLVLVIALLVLSNACLDYTAVCKVLDVNNVFEGALEEIAAGDANGQLKLMENVVACTIALGLALTLWVLPRIAANNIAMGSRGSCIAALGAVAAIALIIASLRFSSDVLPKLQDSDAGYAAVLKGVSLVLVMVALSAGEAIASYSKQRSALRVERAKLQALKLRLQADLDDVDARVQAAGQLADLAKSEAFCACEGAGESLYQGLLTLSGEFQNDFIRFTTAITDSRVRFSQQLFALARTSQVAFAGVGVGAGVGATGVADAGAAAADASVADAPALASAVDAAAVGGMHAGPACGQVAA